MSKDVLDMNRQPVNRVAAQVTGKGTHWEPEKKRMMGDSETPLPVLSRDQMDGNQRSNLDAMLGKKFGRLTVMGVAADQGGKSTRGMRYVVRCDCGTYTYRRSKSITNEKNGIDCCDNCRHLIHLKRTEIYRRTGKDVNAEDVA